MPDDRRDLEESTERWMWAGLILMVLFILAFPLYRFYEPAQRADAREAQSASLAALGGRLFAGSCESCHGDSGSGAVAPALGARQFLESVDDAQITQLIASGVPGTEMVAYSNDYGGPLTSQEITAITTYLRSLEEEAFDMVNWRTPLENESLTGQELFILACSRCHGVDAEGSDDFPDISSDSLTMDESDEWIIGRNTDGYKLMPRFGRILTQEQIAAIVAYLRFGENAPVTTTTTPDTTSPDTTGTTAPRTPDNDDILALGEVIFQERAGGYGCQECHNTDASGTPNGPNIQGASRSQITGNLNGGIPDMDFQPRLTNEEVEAVYQYLLWLTGRLE
jgi:mono/diheme cytochrome c family protein